MVNQDLIVDNPVYSMKNIDTKWLYDFLTLESCRNFSQAAEKSNISQSAFSRRIRSLESALGITLFDRNSSPLKLTEQGKLFHLQTRSLLQQLESNLNELAGYDRLNQPNIKIAAAHSLSLTLLPKLIKTLSGSKKPFIYQVEAIDVIDAVNTLKEGKSDFILSFYDEELQNLPFTAIKLFDSQLYPVSLIKEERSLFTLTQPNLPLLNYTPSSYMGRLVNRCLTQQKLLSLQTVFISSMSELLKNMVLNGHGIAWLPYYSITSELSRGELVCLDKQALTIPIQIFMYRMNTRLNKTAEQFWQLIKNSYSNQ